MSSGYGSQAMALERLGADFEHYKISEWEINANKSYHAIHNPEKNYDFGRFLTKEELVYALLTLGVSNDGKTPMKKESLMRKSEDWLRNVYNEFRNNDNLGSICNIKGEDLKIEDTDKCTYLMTYSFPCFTANSLILTQNGFKKIKEVKEGDLVLTHNNQYKKVLASKCTGVKEIYQVDAVCTDKLECTANHKFLVTTIVDNKMTNPSWVEAKDLTDEHYLMMPINEKSVVPKLQVSLDNENLWYRVGEIIYMLSSKLKSIEDKYDNELMNKLISMFIDEKNHVFIPNFVLDLPINLLTKFLDGFITMRKSRSRIEYFSYTGKRNLIYMLGQCITKAYRKPFIIKETFMVNECKIELDIPISSKDLIYTSKYLLYRITSAKNLGIEDKVYDIEVKDDHSFVVNNCIAHNCQDLSNSGKGKGMKKGSGTRSGLLWEVERILQELVDEGKELPQVLLMENVPQVISSKNIDDFNEWCSFLERIGYSNHHQILNAKDYGIAQSRKRCFMVSLLGNYDYEFPKAIPLLNILRDYLEEVVDEKYYINSENAKKLIKELVESGRLDNLKTDKIIYDDYNSNVRKDQDTINTITTNFGNEAVRNRVKIIEKVENGVIIDDTMGFEEKARVYDEYSPSLRSSRAGLKTIVAMRGRNPENPSNCYAGAPSEQRLEPNGEGICNTLTTVTKDNLLLEHPSNEIKVLGNYNASGHDASRVVATNGVAPTVKENYGTITGIVDKYRIRKLTERECGRLMGVTDADIDKMKAVCCGSQLYKQYGNSIVVNCLMAIMSQLGIKGVTKWNDLLSEASLERPSMGEGVDCGDGLGGIHMLGMLDIKGNEQIRRVYGLDGIAPTITTMQGGNRQPKILEPRHN